MMKSLFSTLLLLTLAAAHKLSPKLQQKLLSKARKLNNDQEYDMTWVPNYSLKFQKCHSVTQIAGEGGGGGEVEEGALYNQLLVEFALCPTESCTTGLGCKHGGKYIINMRQFVEVYMEAKREQLEQQCENVRNYCNCQYANDDDVCQNQCLIDAGLEACVEWEGEDGEEVDIERYMECEAMEGNNDNNNNNNNQNYNYDNQDGYYYGNLYIGPYCANNGQKVLLGVFYDEGCTAPADEGLYEKMNYGYSLPYSTTSIIDMDCISCEQIDEDNNNNNNGNNNGNNNNNNNNNNWNNYYYKEVNEMCAQLYEQAGKCESNLQNINYPITTACTYMDDVLPRLESASSSSGSYRRGNGSAARAFAWVFGILSVALGIYAFLLYRRLRRSKVSLTGNTRGSMA